MAVRGLRQVQINFGRVTEAVERAIKEGMVEATNDLSRRAKQQAPLDTGDLRGSGIAEVEEVYSGIKGSVSFNKPYALKQHEDMTFNHPRGGKAKYLTDPLNQNATKYRRMIQEKARRATR